MVRCLRMECVQDGQSWGGSRGMEQRWGEGPYGCSELLIRNLTLWPAGENYLEGLKTYQGQWSLGAVVFLSIDSHCALMGKLWRQNATSRRQDPPVPSPGSSSPAPRKSQDRALARFSASHRKMHTDRQPPPAASSRGIEREQSSRPLPPASSPLQTQDLF